MLCTRVSFRARLENPRSMTLPNSRRASCHVKHDHMLGAYRSSSCTRLCSHSIGSPYQWVVLPWYRDMMVHPRVAPSDNSIMIRLIVEINTGSARGATRTRACIHICIYAYMYIVYILYMYTCVYTHAHTQCLGQFTPPVKYDMTINFVPSIGWSIASSIITIVRLSRLWAITMPRYNSQVIIRAVCISSRITLLHWQKTFIISSSDFIYAPLIEIFNILWNLIVL